METFRLPRFNRANAVDPILLTKRDRQILRLVHRHRFLRSNQIVVLVGGSQQQLLRRLKLLYHHGYVERPRAQLDYYYQGGSRQMVYGLGNKGGSLLKQELGSAFRPLLWGEKNRAVGRVFLEHALLVSDVMVAFELACRNRGAVRLLYGDQLSLPERVTSRRQPFKWYVNIDRGRKLGVIPDRVFALEQGNGERAYFFLEADRGTMPVKRRSLVQTSFHRKFLAYVATWSQSIHSTRFGFPRFRVLTVTIGAARVKSLVAACSRLDRGQGLFLFADRTVLEEPDELLSRAWQTGKQRATSSLLD